MDVKSHIHESSYENVESLFSFEFVVESVSNLLVECTAPAVGIRLLDYPTIVIYHTGQEKVENLRLLANNETEKSRNDGQMAAKGEIRPDLRENDGSFCFQKGKSTLFSMTWQRLSNRLSNIPLYIVLFDVYEDKNTRLIGNCTVSLHSIVDEIRNKVCHGMHAATFSKRIINVSLFNLMGAKIGQLKGNITLYCYGNSLNKHFQSIKEIEASGMDIFLDKQNSSKNAANDELRLKICKSRKSPNALKKVEAIDKSTETDHMFKVDNHLCIEDECKPSVDKFHTKSDREAKRNVNNYLKYVRSRVKSHFDEYDIEMGTCCPPPLFYCSDNVDPVPIYRPLEASQLHSKNDAGERKGEVNPTAGEADFLLSVENVDDEVQCNKAQSKFPMQSKRDSKNEGGSHSIKFERSSKDCLPVNATEGARDLGTIYSSLDSMPLLQGLLKEIIGFNEKEGALKSKNTKESSKAASFGPTPESSKRIEERKKFMLSNALNRQSKEGRVVTEKNKYNSKKVPRKLNFKATKSHKLRCAMNASKKDDKSQYSFNKPVISINKEMGGPGGKHIVNNTDLQMNESPAGVKKVINHLDDSSSHPILGKLCDISSNNLDQASIKSRSPVSMEVYMPSTAGSNANSDSSEELKEDNPVSCCDNSEDHSGIYWPKPLEKKWSRLDDLSHMKESTKVLPSEDSNLELTRSIQEVLSNRSEPASIPQSSSRRASYSSYSERFHLASISGTPCKEKEAAQNSVNSGNYAALSHGSSFDSLRQSEKSSKRKGSEVSKNQNPPRPLSQRSNNSSRSSLKSHSNYRTPSRNNSEASKPIVSAHSPTTSRSLRTKPRNTYQSNDEITHSVDMSSDESLRTDSRKEDSLPEDDIKDGAGLFQEIQHYSDDFVSVNSPGSSTLEENRSPTPKHFTL